MDQFTSIIWLSTWFFTCLPLGSSVVSHIQKEPRSGRDSFSLPALRLRDKRADLARVSALRIAGIDRGDNEVVGISGLHV